MESEFLMRVILFLPFLVCLSACIEEINFSKSDEAEHLLVVDGMIEAGDQAQHLRLTLSDRLGKSVFTPVDNALITLRSVDGAVTEFVSLEEGFYQTMPGALDVRHGMSYFIIILFDGKEYQSTPEQIPAKQSMNAARFSIEGEFLQLIVENTAPENSGFYLKWEVFNLFAFTELICSPLANPKTCYVEVPFNPQALRLMDGTQFNPGTQITKNIGQVVVSDQFGNPNSFLIIQYAITREAYEFFTRIDIVSNQLGSIYDPQPAIVRGNIFNVNDAQEIVLGYVSGAALDTAVVFTYRSDFVPEFPVVPHCGFLGFGRASPECCNCLLQPNATIEKPDYWP